MAPKNERKKTIVEPIVPATAIVNSMYAMIKNPSLLCETRSRFGPVRTGPTLGTVAEIPRVYRGCIIVGVIRKAVLRFTLMHDW